MRKPHLSTGRLLDTVSYAMRKPCTAKNLMGNDITVIDTFPYNPESKTAPETAKHWAEGYSWNNKNCDPAEYLNRVNEPFIVSITDLDVRTEGGRAYKVIDPEGRRFDLREDQVIEVMRKVGIRPGGDIPATFVWGLMGSQLRLVLVGGDLYTEMLEQTNALKDVATRKVTGDALTPSKLQVGHVYKRRDGHRLAFIGRVKVPEIDKVACYAFMENLPPEEVPERWDGNDYTPITSGWDEMTLDEQIIFLRTNEQWRSDYVPIKLLQSPKVDNWTDVGQIDITYYKENKDGKCHYADGVRNDIVEYRHEQKFGRRPYSDPTLAAGTGWRLGREELDRRHKEFHASQQRLMMQARCEFRDKLVWL